MKVFIVNGRGTSGKTTFETMVCNIAKKCEKTVEIRSTIDCVKEFAREIGWNGTKTPEDRRFLSDLKDALTRWKDVPYQNIKAEIQKCAELNVSAIFIDCREPSEIKRFVEDYNATTVLVQRGEFVMLGNHADDNVLNYQYDVVIDNSRGLTELEEEATIFVETFLND